MPVDVLSASSAELLERFGSSTGRLILQAASLARASDPGGVLAALHRHRAVLTDEGQTTYDELYNVVGMEISLINQLEGSPAAQDVIGSRSVLEVFDEVTRTLDEVHRPDQAAAAFLRMAWMAALADQEITGLALLHEAGQLSADFATRNAWLLEICRALFFDREGSNRYADGDRAQSMTYCLRALEFASRQGRADWAERLLTRIADLAPYADETALINALALLPRLAPLLARMLGEPADRRQREIYGGLIAAMLSGGGVNSEMLWALLQFACGLRTAMMVAAPKLSLVADPRAAELLSLLEQDRAAMRHAPLARPEPERVSLREAFEERRRSMLIEVMPHLRFASLEQFRALLDQRTVMLCVYIAQLPFGARVKLGYAIWEAGQVLVVDTDPATMDGLDGIVGLLADTLDGLRESGLDHICIYGQADEAGRSPHLARLGEGLLADHWLVTSLPHPSMLFPPDSPLAPSGRTENVVAFGLGFESGQHDQPPIPDAPAEAESIAASLNGIARVDDASTEAKFRELAPRARRVHLATHGRSSESTPSFHQLLLTPEPPDDGVLYAWEIAELDLAGLELATLSACESAETVVDQSGNVEGMAIAFLRAGAQAVIGTLWEIETACSRVFFESLYKQLAASASRGEAFRAAQSQTRRLFPGERDWPAFFLIGDWR